MSFVNTIKSSYHFGSRLSHHFKSGVLSVMCSALLAGQFVSPTYSVFAAENYTITEDVNSNGEPGEDIKSNNEPENTPDPILSTTLESDQPANSSRPIDNAEFVQQTLVKTIGKYEILADGYMPEGAELSAHQLFNINELEEVIGDEDYSIYAAFDIEILVDGEIWQPVDDNETVAITITNVDVSEEAELKIYRIEDEVIQDPSLSDNENIVELNAVVNTNGDITMETEHFTTYVVGGVTYNDPVVSSGTWLGLNYQTFDHDSDGTAETLVFSGTQTIEISNSSSGTRSYTTSPYYRNSITTISAQNGTKLIDMGYLFYKCSNLTTIDLSKADVSSVKDFGWMCRECSSLVTININNWNTANGTTFEQMFSSCSKLTSLDASNFNTSNATQLNYMFAGCTSLTTLDVSGFNTSKATSMEGMFSSCSSLTTLDVSHFNTSQVTSMWSMFNRCSSLTSLDVSNFNTSNVTYMPFMFADCSLLTSLDVSGFNTSSVTSMQHMFSGCSSLTVLDVSNFNTTKVKWFEFTFYGCSLLTSLDVSGFDTSSTESFEYMFSGCSLLTSLDVSNFNTAKASIFRYMFSNCQSLTFLDISKFDTSNITTMQGMFYNCSSLTAINIGDLNTSKVTDFSNMFSGCKNLATLDIYGLNTSSAQWLSRMFENCASLQMLDLSNWDTSNVLSMYEMFKGSSVKELNIQGWSLESIGKHADFEYRIDKLGYNASSSSIKNPNDHLPAFPYKLRKLQAPKAILSTQTVNLPSDKWYLDDNNDEIPDNETVYTTLINGITNTSHAYKVYKIAKFDASRNVNARIKKLAGTATASYNTANTNILHIKWTDTPIPANDDNLLSSRDSIYEIYAKWNADTSTIEMYTIANTIQLSTVYDMFYNLQTVQDIGIFGGSKIIDTSNVSDMSSMFSNCKALTTLNLSGLNTSSATTFYNMFNNCLSLTTLDVSNWDTTSVTDFGNMFYNCQSLTTLDVSSFNATNRTDTYSIFYNCYALTTLKAPTFTKSETELPSKTGCLWYIDDNEDNIADSKTTYVKLIYPTTTSHTYVRTDKEGFALPVFTSTLVSGSNFSNALKNLANDTTTASINTNDTKIQKIKWTATPFTSAVNVATSDSDMPIYARKASPIDAQYSHTSNISDGGIQNGTYSNSLKTKDVISISEATSLHITLKYGTENNYDQLYVFQGEYTGSVSKNMEAGQLAKYQGNGSSPQTVEFDVEGDTVTFAFYSDSSSAYYGYYAIVEGVGMPETSLCAIELYTDADTVYLNEDSSQMFTDFHRLESIPFIENPLVNTVHVTNMSKMFYNCNSMSFNTLNLSNFDTQNVTDMSSMFAGCNYLKNLNLNSFDTSNVTNMYSMFSANWQLLSPIAENFNTQNVTNMQSMFDGCSAITNLDLSGWNVSNVTNMHAMFQSCYQLTDLNLTGWQTSSLQSASNMFNVCQKLTSLNLRGFDTSNTTAISMMFSGCTSLTELDLSSFDISNISGNVSLFNECINLTKINAPKTIRSNAVISLPIKEKNAWYLDDELPFFKADNTQTYTNMLAGINNTSHTYIRSDHANFIPFITTSTLISGTEFNTRVKSFISNTEITTSVTEDNLVKDIRLETYNSNVAPENSIIVSHAASDVPIYAVFDAESGILSLKTKADIIYMPTHANHMFNAFSAMESISIVSDEKLDTSKIHTLDGTFSKCGSLRSIDLSNWNTDQVTNIHALFFNDYKLKNINLHGWQTGSITNMESTFFNCHALNTLDISSFDTSEVLTMKQMFGSCRALSELNLSHFNTNKTNNMQGMFTNCTALTNLNISNFNTAKITDMSSMFNNCSRLTNIDISNFNTSQVTNMSNMFADCILLQEIAYDIHTFDTSNVTNMSSMYKNCQALESIDLSTYDMDSITNVASMFDGCTNLQSVILPINLTSIGDNMFAGTKHLTLIKGGTQVVSIGQNAFYAGVDVSHRLFLYLEDYKTLKACWRNYPWRDSHRSVQINEVSLPAALNLQVMPQKNIDLVINIESYLDKDELNCSIDNHTILTGSETENILDYYFIQDGGVGSQIINMNITPYIADRTRDANWNSNGTIRDTLTAHLHPAADNVYTVDAYSGIITVNFSLAD